MQWDVCELSWHTPSSNYLTLTGQHSKGCEFSSTDSSRKRFYSPVANHVERKLIGDHVPGLPPPSGDDYSGDLGLVWRWEQRADFRVPGLGMSDQWECHAGSRHQF